MKKTLFSCVMFAAALCASAYDEIGVKCATPLVVDDITQVSLVLNNSSYVDCLRYLQCTVELPSDWIVDVEYTMNKERFCDYNTKLKKWGTSKFSIDCDYGADNELKLLMYGTDPANTLNLTAGELFTFGVYVPEGTPAGYYPVIIKDGGYMAKSSVDAENIYFGKMVSYVKVGEPAKGSLALSATVPSFVNEALATETGLASLDLEKVTALNGDFTYVDGRDVVGTAATASVKYVGNKAEKEYYSVNVPFDGAVTGTGKVYELSEVTEEYAIFNEAASVVAGKTYLAEGAVTLAANAAVASVATETGKEGSYVLDGKFWHGKNLTVPATRGLFDVPAGSNLRVVIDGVLTNITTAQIEAGETSYDLQGRQVQNAKNGVFVVNGKKQFVK